MEFTLLFIIGCLFGYIVFKDLMFAKERDSLQLKLMSKDVGEYLTSLSDIAESEDEPDPFIPVEEVDYEKINKAL